MNCTLLEQPCCVVLGITELLGKVNAVGDADGEDREIKPTRRIVMGNSRTIVKEMRGCW
jgi:hypothetical protein